MCLIPDVGLIIAGSVEFQVGCEALAALGHAADGITQLENGLAQWIGLGTRIANSFWYCFFAEAYGCDARWQQARDALAKSRQTVQESDERYREAELCRLEGDLALAIPPGDAAQAESRYGEAIEVARKHEAKSLELRASVSLAKLWQSQCKGKKAHDHLAPVYAWFTEGFDTRDLKEAHTLLLNLRA